MAAALAKLRRDVERFRPALPGIAYALMGETHKAIMEDWREAGWAQADGCLETQLECLLGEVTRQMRRLHTASISDPADDRARLQAQADMMLEEIRRIEAELSILRPQRAAA
jgi:hypothetical protein